MQITLTSSDIPQNLDDWMVTTGDSIDLVNVGHSGGPHHLEFHLVNPVFSEMTYVGPPGDSPVLDSFPATDLLYVTKTRSGATKGTHYAHYDLSSPSLLGLGWAGSTCRYDCGCLLPFEP